MSCPILNVGNKARRAGWTGVKGVGPMGVIKMLINLVLYLKKGTQRVSVRVS